MLSYQDLAADEARLSALLDLSPVLERTLEQADTLPRHTLINLRQRFVILRAELRRYQP